MREEFDRLEDALKDLREGKPIIVVDDPKRENEGDFVAASSKITPQVINLMAKRGGGLICVTMTEDRFKELELELPITNTSHYGTPFGIPIDAKDTGTGASAYDRALTARWVADPTKSKDDFVKPGHLYTLRATPGGVLKRAGHTEASVDLVRMAGLYPSAVICEILDEDGSMARLPRLMALAKELDLRIISIGQIIEHRLRKEKLIKRIWQGNMETPYGDFQAVVYREKLSPNTHIVLIKEPLKEEVLVRVQSHCVAGNVFRSTGCACGESLEKSLKLIAREGGIFVYIRRTSPPEYPFFHLMGVSTEDDGTLREYGIGMQILKDLGVKKAILLTGREKVLPGYEGFGIEIKWKKL
ncbi:MAG: 3,4-dihydroxy-2-butanone-4-phosphate synthase [Thermotogae bacterium]|nr:3,4-dihydroxy-2-butanone-4-phosphate synthase [Thermotogota bacterium]